MINIIYGMTVGLILAGVGVIMNAICFVNPVKSMVPEN